MAEKHQFERLMTPSEVADIFKVDPKTVTRWAAAGLIESVVTIGGHRRFPESAVIAKLESGRSGVTSGVEASGGDEETGAEAAAGDARA